MVISFTEQKRKQKYLSLVLAGVVLLTLFVLWRGYFTEKKSTAISVEKQVIFQPKKIEINFDILNSPQFNNLRPFEEIPLPEEIETGRENPFLPYQKVEVVEVEGGE